MTLLETLGGNFALWTVWYLVCAKCLALDDGPVKASAGQRRGRRAAASLAAPQDPGDALVTDAASRPQWLSATFRGPAMRSFHGSPPARVHAGRGRRRHLADSQRGSSRPDSARGPSDLPNPFSGAVALGRCSRQLCERCCASDWKDDAYRAFPAFGCSNTLGQGWFAASKSIRRRAESSWSPPSTRRERLRALPSTAPRRICRRARSGIRREWSRSNISPLIIVCECSMTRLLCMRLPHRSIQRNPRRPAYCERSPLFYANIWSSAAQRDRMGRNEQHRCGAILRGSPRGGPT
jgi:hypothetical protein